MVKVDNDATKYAAHPFIILAGVRTGGTFLSHCLSNHPDMFCDRAESLHHASIWRSRVRCLNSVQLVALLTHMEGYQASGCKLTYRQALLSRPLWKYIENHKPHIIFLSRRNRLRQGVSRAYNQHVRRGLIPEYPVHSFKETEPPKPVKIAPRRIITSCRKLVKDESNARKVLKRYKGPILYLTYEGLVGGEGCTRKCITANTQARICHFLGVPSRALCCELRRIHSHPLRAIFSNWPEIETAVKKSPFAKFLKEENAWRRVNGEWRVSNGCADMIQKLESEQWLTNT